MAAGSLSARVPWRTIVVTALTIALLWLFFRNVDFAGLWRALTQAHVGLIFIAVIITLQTYFVRARRWQALLAPIGRARFRTAFRTTVIGFATTFLLPARVGEVLRPYLLARQEGFKPTSTFATVVVERILDVVSVLLLFSLSLPFLSVDIGANVRWGGAIAASFALAALVMLFVSAGHPERLSRWVAVLARWLPARVGAAITNLARTFAEGLAVMRRPSRLAVVMAWSIGLWLSLGLQIWITSRAFDLTFSFPGTFLVLMFLVIGVSAPTPGGVGAFHYAYQYSVTHFFDASPDAAAAAALVLHAVSFVPVTLMGLAFMGQDGLTIGSMKDLRATAQAAETP